MANILEEREINEELLNLEMGFYQPDQLPIKDGILDYQGMLTTGNKSLPKAMKNVGRFVELINGDEAEIEVAALGPLAAAAAYAAVIMAAVSLVSGLITIYYHFENIKKDEEERKRWLQLAKDMKDGFNEMNDRIDELTDKLTQISSTIDLSLG